MSKQIIFTNLFLFLLLASCGLKKEEIPAYVHVSDYTLEAGGVAGSNSNKIDGVWVIQSSQEQGVYEFPATFPILSTRGSELLLLAGITVNGISTTRASYPFYNSYRYDRPLIPGEVDTIIPEWEYADFASFVFVEDFESGNDFINLKRTSVPSEVFEGNVSGKMVRDTTVASAYFEAENAASYFIPRTSPYVYLELDYKNNTSFGIGLKSSIANDPRTITYIKLNVNPQEDWNKLYVNLYPDIQNLDADEYKIVFRVQDQTIPDEEVEVYFDNIKLIYARDI